MSEKPEEAREWVEWRLCSADKPSEFDEIFKRKRDAISHQRAFQYVGSKLIKTRVTVIP